MRSGSPVIDAIWRAHAAFVATDPLPQPDLPFWINLLEQQVMEAREHEAAGRRDKALAEMADAVLVAFRAIHVATGEDPEPLIVDRIETRIIPRTREIAQRDRAGNGYKEARVGSGSKRLRWRMGRLGRRTDPRTDGKVGR